MGADPYAATNPRRALIRREEQAMAEAMPAVAPPPAAASGVQFGRQFSPAERQAQQAALAKMLQGRK